MSIGPQKRFEQKSTKIKPRKNFDRKRMKIGFYWKAVYFYCDFTYIN